MELREDIVKVAIEVINIAFPDLFLDLGDDGNREKLAKKFVEVYKPLHKLANVGTPDIPTTETKKD